MSALAPTLEAFFTDRLINEKGASQHTIAAYRDTFRLLLSFTQQRIGKQPCELDIAVLDAPLIVAFLDHLERDRGNSPRTRNARLAAIHSLFRFAALRHPEHAALIGRVLAVPTKRFDRAIVSYLTKAEADALINAPNPNRWIGRRDHALLTLAIQTGVRVSELTALRCQDVHLGTGAHVRITGKGRKQRATPLTKHTAAVKCARNSSADSTTDKASSTTVHDSVPSCGITTGSTRTRVSRLEDTGKVTRPRRKSAQAQPALQPVMDSAQGLQITSVDTTVIALWLGHESVEATQIYIHADMTIKERALAAPPRPTALPAATSHQTPCSRSSRRSDYAEHHLPIPASTQRSRPILGIIRRSA